MPPPLHSQDVDTTFGCGEKHLPLGSTVGELGDGTLLSVSFRTTVLGRVVIGNVPAKSIMFVIVWTCDGLY